MEDIGGGMIDDERTVMLRADFEIVYAPDEISNRALERDANGKYILMQTHHAWIWWLDCANFYRVGE
jgi:hypothetical protein